MCVYAASSLSKPPDYLHLISEDIYFMYDLRYICIK